MNAAAARARCGAVATTLVTAESMELLRGEQFGRICIEADGCPVAFPVNYVVDEPGAGTRIVIRTAPGTMIGGYRGRASLEVDCRNLVSGRAWSVIVRGELNTLVGGDMSDEPEPFVAGDRSQRMELKVASMSGRAFTAERSGFLVDWQLED